MNDERAVEVMERAFYEATDPHLDANRGDFIKMPLVSQAETTAYLIHHGLEAALAALRAEGFDLYRPDDCWEAKADRSSSLVTSDAVAPGRYRLVPVGGDSSDGPVCGGPSVWHKECDPSCGVVGR